MDDSALRSPFPPLSAPILLIHDHSSHVTCEFSLTRVYGNTDGLVLDTITRRLSMEDSACRWHRYNPGFRRISETCGKHTFIYVGVFLLFSRFFAIMTLLEFF